MMRMGVVVVVGLLASTAARAQGPTAPGSPLALLTKQRVQMDLKLSVPQLATVKRLYDDVKKDPTAAKTAFATLNKTLDAKQRARLKQIGYQVRGGAALGDGDLARALKLSDKQKAEVRSIWTNEEKTLGMLLKVSRFRNETARQKFINDHRKKAGDKMLGVLTEEQKKQFAGLLGNKIDTADLDLP